MVHWQEKKIKKYLLKKCVNKSREVSHYNNMGDFFYFKKQKTDSIRKNENSIY